MQTRSLFTHPTSEGKMQEDNPVCQIISNQFLAFSFENQAYCL